MWWYSGSFIHCTNLNIFLLHDIILSAEKSFSFFFFQDRFSFNLNFTFRPQNCISFIFISVAFLLFECLQDPKICKFSVENIFHHNLKGPSLFKLFNFARSRYAFLPPPPHCCLPWDPFPESTLQIVCEHQFKFHLFGYNRTGLFLNMNRELLIIASPFSPSSVKDSKVLQMNLNQLFHKIESQRPTLLY